MPPWVYLPVFSVFWLQLLDGDIFTPCPLLVHWPLWHCWPTLSPAEEYTLTFKICSFFCCGRPGMYIHAVKLIPIIVVFFQGVHSLSHCFNVFLLFYLKLQKAYTGLFLFFFLMLRIRIAWPRPLFLPHPMSLLQPPPRYTVPVCVSYIHLGNAIFRGSGGVG